MRNPMRNSLLVSPLRPSELYVLRELGRVGRSFEAMFAALVRAQFLRAVLGPVLGRRGARGMLLAERAALLALVAEPARDTDQIRRKALLARCHDAEEGDPIIDMLCAGIEADCRRLGLVGETLDLEIGKRPPTH